MKPIRLMAAMALLAGSCAAHAQVFSEPALDALYRESRFAELDRIAQQRLASTADDRQAVLAAALVSQQSKGTAAQRQAAIARAEACLERQPKAAECHYALGSTLGIQAMNEGMLKMASSVGRVRTSLTEAVVQAPQWYPARSALVSFYVMVPGLMGGSRDKAVATARAAATPEQVQALMAVVAIADEKPEAALEAVQGIRRGTDSGLDDDLRSIGHNAGLALLNAGQGAKARSWFERAQRERPTDTMATYGLGRVHAEAGAHAEAVAWYEKAAKLEDAGILPIDYRIGLAQQALGQPAAAKAAFTRFVAAGKGARKSLDDAKKRLEQLGTP
jgi:tetratricopeptide (TPR) repeat protein